ncbi:Osmotically-inducible protein OsmY, contains BON domain [Oryzisolibacter propanilivorax]|uniref:Osmotically-inducible protein OsmY, contains BON domain n=1 Tax=Oryzisolibacter propanilivorax TaxID=1527607 RepID=A0A1G9SC01_9BURK|nr:BON domain-containing protein [Oryzisolibacter propanilivorax]SDM33033.1 Osmotically-inducible protein OsmY, contains BON domain [Oryzisolibacter propanilivorax]
MNPFLTRGTLAVLATASLAASLTACVPLVIGGSAVVGTLIAVDRRTTGAQVEDEGIELRAANRIRETLGERVHVNVTSYNRQVLLTGEASSAGDVQKVEQVVRTVENVQSIVNDVGVMAQTSLSQRSADTFITGKVRASLVDARDLSASAFKVVTERNVVYLMGRVTQREAKRAAEIARGVDGVRKVVRVFEVLTEEELSRQLAAPVTQDPAAASTPAKP